jgi:hypothetical protein
MNPQKLCLDLKLTAGKRSKPRTVYIQRIKTKKGFSLDIDDRGKNIGVWNIIPFA